MTTNNNNARKSASSSARKPRNGPVRIAQVEPTTLENVNLSAPATALPPHLAAALAAAQSKASARRSAAKAPTPRVSVSPAEAQTLQAMGWQPPYVDADLTVAPKPRKRFAACKGETAYEAAAAILASQNLTVCDLAALWLATGNQPKPLNAILQQVANRSQRKVCQDGAILTLA